MPPNNFEESILMVLSSLLIVTNNENSLIKSILPSYLSIVHLSLKTYLLYVEAISSICMKTS